MRDLARRIWLNRAGIVAVEFALVMPILLLLLMGSLEFGRMVLLSYKLQNGAFILADLAGRSERLSASDLDHMFLALDTLVQPFDFSDNAVAIVTSVSGTETGDPVVNWQRFGGGTLVAASAVGTEGDDANLPDVLVLEDGETVLVSEIIYHFEPLLGIVLKESTIHKVAYLKPRLGTLETLD